MSNKDQKKNRKPWPKDCVWPDPARNGFFRWEAEDAESMPFDEDVEDLLEIKEYMDEQVECGRLNEDYSLNPDYADWYESDNEAELEDDDDPWAPEKGEDFWSDNGFDIDYWNDELTEHLCLLKLPVPSPVSDIQQIIGYEFINENLLRQAFTRRAFGIEHKTGNSEVLELIGDAVLNTVVTREIARHLTDVDATTPASPFTSSCREGELTRIRQHYVCKEYLAERAAALGLDQYILYGSNEIASDNALEDVMEALIGAVAADSNWDWHTLEGVVDKLLCIQISESQDILHPSYYDIFNAWHQKKFGKMPDYEIGRGRPCGKNSNEYDYECTLRFLVPNIDKGTWTSQRVDVQRESRSKARELAAEMAYHYVVSNGLWMSLKDAGVEPDLENSINQLQELYQKKYVDQPEYVFEEWDQDKWNCFCICGGVSGWGKANGKTKAKKKAAYMVLVRLMKSAGICEDEWEKTMWETM